MPTHHEDSEFLRDYAKLNREQRRLFKSAVSKFREDLVTGQIRPGLRVKGVQARPGVFEMTWAPDGRAMFRYGDPVRGNDRHVIWMRVGTHDIFDE